MEIDEMDIVKEFDPLFNPRSIAVIGATNNFNKWGYSTFLSTITSGFKGKVYPVNWKEKKVLGYPAFKKVIDIPDPVDLAVFVIPAQNIPSAMEYCVEKGVKSAVIISAGFAETGGEGKKLQDDVLRIAKKGKIRFVGPNCMGFWSATSSLRAFMFPLQIRTGPIAFVTQGGNVGGSLLMDIRERGLGFRRYVSCGCTADIQIEDYIEYFGKDPEIKVILAYIEGLNDGRKFINKVKEVTQKKPVVVLKPGKSEVTARAIMSHSGSLSGSYTTYDEAFKKAGAIRVDSTEELLDVAIGLLSQPLPRGRNIAVITPGGSYGVLCTDCCAPLGLNMIKLPENIVDEFNAMFPPRWSHGNPVDPAGERNFVPYLKAVEKVLELKEVDSLIFMGFGAFSGFGGMIEPMLEDPIETITAFISTFVSPFPAISAIDPENLDIRQILSMIGIDPENLDIRQILSMIAPIISAGDVKSAEEFIPLVLPIIEFGKADMIPIANDIVSSIIPGIAPERIENLVTPMVKYDRVDITPIVEEITPIISRVISGQTEDLSKILDMNKILQVVDSFLGMAIFYWISTYKKPIITTTFTEAKTHLITFSKGIHFPYTSPERAARVLAKLVEYGEYLEREGVCEK